MLMRVRLRRRLGALFAAMGLFVVTSCTGEFDGIYDIPLPGGAELGENPYTVTIYFADVVNLVPQSGVQLNNVTVGNVKKIEFAEKGWNAKVTIVLNGEVDLPANTRAYVRQTALLGEKYVQLEAPPPSKAYGELKQGSVIPLAHTDRSVEIEEILGALSMLLNGGGIKQINEITEELNKALDGNIAEIKALLHNANKLVTNLDNNSENITNALDALNKLSATLAAQTDKIKNVLENLAPGLRVLESQREMLVRMLKELRNLSKVAVNTIQESREDFVANLRSLLPTLRQLAKAGSDLPKALEILFTFPFADSAVKAVKGDYFNLYATIDLNLQHILKNLSRSRQYALESLPILGDLIPKYDGAVPGSPPPLPLRGSDSRTGSRSGSQTGSQVGSLGASQSGSRAATQGGTGTTDARNTSGGGILDLLNLGGGS